MRRVMLLVVSVLTIVTMTVSPAFAGDRDGDGWDEDFGFWIFVPVFVVFDVDFDGVDDNFDCDFVFCEDFDEDDFDEDDFDEDDFDDFYFDDFYFDEDDCEGPVCLID